MRTEEATRLAPAPEDDFEAARSKRTMIVLLLFIGVMASLWVAGPIIFASHDDPTAIDSKAVRPTLSQSCRQLGDDLKNLPAGLAAPEKAEAENLAVDRFVARIRALGPDKLNKDEPVNRWLADWERIVATRREAVRSGKRYETPAEGSAPINVRMFALVQSGLAHCDVPKQLLTPQPGTL